MLEPQGRKSSFLNFTISKKVYLFRLYQHVKIFDKMVILELCFAAKIWGYTYSKRVETVHATYNFCKRFLDHIGIFL